MNSKQLAKKRKRFDQVAGFINYLQSNASTTNRIPSNVMAEYTKLWGEIKKYDPNYIMSQILK